MFILYGENSMLVISSSSYHITVFYREFTCSMKENTVLDIEINDIFKPQAIL